MRSRLARLVDFVRYVFASEELEPAEPVERTDRPAPQRGFVQRLLAGESLPADGPVEPDPRETARPRGLRSFASMLFAPEPLPRDEPTPKPERQGAALLRSVFTPERLPFDEVAPDPVRRGPGWLRLLFVPESLPKDELSDATPAAGTAGRRGVNLRWLFAHERLANDDEGAGGGSPAP